MKQVMSNSSNNSSNLTARKTRRQVNLNVIRLWLPMELSKDNCSIALVVTSLTVLVVNHGYLAVESLSISAGALSLSGIKATNTLFLPILAFSLLIGFCLCHIRHHWPEISNNFSSGYREAPAIVELVRGAVSVAAKSDKYGSPHGGIRGALKIRSTDLGRFQKPSGELSESVTVEPDAKAHLQAVSCGIQRTLAPKLWLRVYAPLLFAIWGLLSISV